jgi:hypothetical protein
VSSLADEVSDQGPKERLALERRERDRGAGVCPERFEPLVAEPVDGPLAGLARLFPGLEIAEASQALGLRVVLALSPPSPAFGPTRQVQQVVGAGRRPADETEDLVREQG